MDREALTDQLTAMFERIAQLPPMEQLIEAQRLIDRLPPSVTGERREMVEALLWGAAGLTPPPREFS